MKQVWKCDYCSYIDVSSDKVTKHEPKCSFNKVNKYCHTCKFSYEEGYDFHIAGCEIGKDTLVGEEEGNCTHWVYEYLDRERQDKLSDLGI